MFYDQKDGKNLRDTMNSNKIYSIKEIFLTLQGEGHNAGKTAVFCRFSGCNLWNGNEKDRKKAICSFCDTDFKGVDGINGGKYSVGLLVKKIVSLWPKLKRNRFIVFTGGEPLLQLDNKLIKKVKDKGFKVAVETNGTLPVSNLIDWVCVSPKIKSELVVTKGDEIKVVYPQDGINLSKYEKYHFKHFYLQPLDNKSFILNNKKTIEYILKNPKWKLSVQTHKYLKIK